MFVNSPLISGSAAIALGADVNIAVSTGFTSPWTPLTAVDAVATIAAAMMQLERAVQDTVGCRPRIVAARIDQEVVVSLGFTISSKLAAMLNVQSKTDQATKSSALL